MYMSRLGRTEQVPKRRTRWETSGRFSVAMLADGWTQMTTANINLTACLIEPLDISTTTAHNIDAHDKLAMI